MSTTRSIDQTKLVCELKAAVTALECYHNAQILKEQKEKIERKATLPNIHIIIPIQHKIRTEKKKVRSKPTSDKRIPLKDTPSIRFRSRDKERADRREKTSRLIFPEMRGGILYSRCCCLHRDGLQDDCPLSQCQGQPECLAKPWAICPPGKFVRLRHPELYPKKSKTHCGT